MTAADIDRAIRAAWRIEQPRLITTLSRMLRDVSLAEELTQDALLAALEAWPATGVPDKPGAWLIATAKRRAFDQLRRSKMLARKHELLLHDAAARLRQTRINADWSFPPRSAARSRRAASHSR